MGPPERAERRPPAGGGAHDDGHDVNTRVTAELAAWDASVMLRRRRAASLRLAPAGDGPADPIDDLALLPIRVPQPCCGAEFGPGGWRACCRGRIA